MIWARFTCEGHSSLFSQNLPCHDASSDPTHLFQSVASTIFKRTSTRSWVESTLSPVQFLPNSNVNIMVIKPSQTCVVLQIHEYADFALIVIVEPFLFMSLREPS